MSPVGRKTAGKRPKVRTTITIDADLKESIEAITLNLSGYLEEAGREKLKRDISKKSRK